MERTEKVEDGMEKKVLLELAQREVMKKSEITDFLRDKVENAEQAASNLIRSLVFKSFVTNVTPVGESCIAITQKGIRAVRE